MITLYVAVYSLLFLNGKILHYSFLTFSDMVEKSLKSIWSNCSLSWVHTKESHGLLFPFIWLGFITIGPRWQQHTEIDSKRNIIMTIQCVLFLTSDVALFTHLSRSDKKVAGRIWQAIKWHQDHFIRCFISHNNFNSNIQILTQKVLFQFHWWWWKILSAKAILLQQMKKYKWLNKQIQANQLLFIEWQLEFIETIVMQHGLSQSFGNGSTI